MAYKVFSNGDALTGSELNTYLMNQSVMVFATTTARDAALPSPLEGMIVWLQDTDKYMYYNGSAWTNLAVPYNTNYIINGAFDIWQRGTSFSFGGSNTFTADRWLGYGYSGTQTVSQQTFTPGTAPVTGYEGQYFLRYACTNTEAVVQTRVEDVRTLAGQTATLSFWAKAASALTITPVFNQEFGTGGSARVDVTGAAQSITTSWTRFSVTVSIPSITGKTIGTGSYLQVKFPSSTLSTNIDLWGVQLEAGSVATSFKRNANSLQGELAACQRYYVRFGGDQINEYFGNAIGETTTLADAIVQYPVTMRTTPSSIDFSTLRISSQTGNDVALTNVALTSTASSSKMGRLVLTAAGSITANRPYFFGTNGSTSGYLGFSAEL